MNKRFFFPCTIIAMMATICLTACNDTLEEYNTSGNISNNINFEIDNITEAVDDAKTRAGSQPTYSKGVLLSEKGDTLYYTVKDDACFNIPRETNDTTAVDTLSVTRGAFITDGSSITAFGISGSAYDANQAATNNPCGNYFYKLRAQPDVPTGYFWPTDDYHMSFYAYYPYNNSALTVSSKATAKGYPQYRYTARSTSSQNNTFDFMTANVIDHACGPQDPVGLQFKHHTAAVRVIFENTGNKNIVLENMYFTSVKYDGKIKNNTWTVQATTDDCYISRGQTLAANKTTDITGTSNIVFVVPQNASRNLTLVTNEDTYVTAISDNWQAGHVYTYTISLDEDYEYILNITQPSAFDYGGGDDSYSIQSYKRDSHGVERPTAWTAYFDADGDGIYNDECPEWLTGMGESGDGGTSSDSWRESFDISVSAAELTEPYESDPTATEILQSRSAVSNYDLSLHDIQGNSISRTTANTYIITRPGSYKFPLVYGNAIKNGSTNTTAFNPPGTASDTFLKPFVNYKDQPITSPWITDDTSVTWGDNPATIIWTYPENTLRRYGFDNDYECDLNNLTADLTNRYMSFEISEDDIQEANYVIGLRDADGKCVWAWTICVSVNDYSSCTEMFTSGNSYEMAPVPIGYINAGKPIQRYEERTCGVRIVQNGYSGLTKDFTVTQTGHEEISYSRKGVAPFFQYGLMCPLPPAREDGSNRDNFSYIDFENNEPVISVTGVYRYSTYPTTVGGMWQYPYKSTYYNPMIYYTNVWDALQDEVSSYYNDYPTTKTIYDPSPIGFCVPSTALAYYLCGKKTITEGQTSTDKNYENVQYDDINKGYLWTGDKPYLYFKGLGWRINSGNLNGVNSAYLLFANSIKYKSYGTDQYSPVDIVFGLQYNSTDETYVGYSSINAAALGYIPVWPVKEQ